MGQPHRHAELIKAWADDTELVFQFKGAGLQSSCWYTMQTPDWSHSTIRIKPRTIRYRVALMKAITAYYTSTAYAESKALEYHKDFVKWISDWVEVEI